MVDWLNQGYNGLLFLAAVAAAVGGIATQTTRYKQWRKRQTARRDALDRLIDNESILSDTHHVRADHGKQLEEINKAIGGLLESQRITAYHNRRQDQEIESNLRFQQVAMEAIESIVDENINNGANGPSHRAKVSIAQWKNEIVYKPQKELEKGRE